MFEDKSEYGLDYFQFITRYCTVYLFIKNCSNHTVLWTPSGLSHSNLREQIILYNGTNVLFPTWSNFLTKHNSRKIL